MNTRDRDGMAALSFAASSGNVKGVALLLKQGANRETRDERGYTPLMNAIANGRLDVVAYLLEQGAKTDTVGRGGVTARKLAVERNSKAIIELLDARAKDEAAAKPAADAARP